jgi:hypothetical protein
MVAIQGFDAVAALRRLAQPVTIVRPKDGLWEAGEQAAQLARGARLIDAPQWGFGLFDAYPQDVAALLRNQLDCQEGSC